MPLDLSDIVNDPDLGQAVVVLRSRGAFALGGWKERTITTWAFGILAPADDRALAQVPEGDRVSGSIQFLSGEQLYTTHEGQSSSGISDKVQWQGELYRVQSVAPWGDNGFWSSILVRMAGN